MTAGCRVAAVRGDDRAGNLTRALDLLRDEIAASIAERATETLFVKVNAIDSNFPLACTHPRALEAVLAWVAPHFKHLIVGDNSFVFSKRKDRHPYAHLSARFPSVQFSDLTELGARSLAFTGVDGAATTVSYSCLPERAYTVSLSLPKTHDAVSFTGCSKNMFGCVLGNRLAMHATTPLSRIRIARLVRSNACLHRNLCAVVAALPADLAIMDAFEGMEGQGPLFGTAVPMRLALVSRDRIAVDSLACELACLPLPQYLEESGRQGLGCTRVSDITLVGTGFERRDDLVRPFRPHYLQPYQLLRELPADWKPRLDLRMVLAYARRFHRLLDKLQETRESGRRERGGTCV